MLRPRRGLVGRGMGVGQGQEPDWMLERVSCRLLFFILFQFLFFSFFLFFFFSFFLFFFFLSLRREDWARERSSYAR